MEELKNKPSQLYGQISSGLLISSSLFLLIPPLFGLIQYIIIALLFILSIIFFIIQCVKGVTKQINIQFFVILILFILMFLFLPTLGFQGGFGESHFLSISIYGFMPVVTDITSPYLSVNTICNKIFFYSKSECYSNYAISNWKPELCDKIESRDIRLNCHGAFAGRISGYDLDESQLTPELILVRKAALNNDSLL